MIRFHDLWRVNFPTYLENHIQDAVVSVDLNHGCHYADLYWIVILIHRLLCRWLNYLCCCDFCLSLSIRLGNFQRWHLWVINWLSVQSCIRNACNESHDDLGWDLGIPEFFFLWKYLGIIQMSFSETRSIQWLAFCRVCAPVLPLKRVCVWGGGGGEEIKIRVW